MLVVLGTVLAIARPGDLGEDTAGPSQATSTTAPVDLTTTTVVTTTTPPAGETTTTIAGSGINTPGPATGGSDGVANTGGESMLGAGLVLGAVGMLLRRASRPTRA